MCGIVACLNYDSQNAVDSSFLRKMTDTLVHRGPNDSGIWSKGQIGLGHRRLSIIDLSSAGRGPMQNADGSLVVTFNGEIYNYRELRPQLETRGYQFRTRTDTEVILHAYAEWGVDCLKRFNGMFAFALWDSRRRRLFVARDRFGVKPLVYYDDGTRFACASELKALLSDRTIPRDMDPVGLHHYLSLMGVPAPYTIYRNIRKLQPGHYLLVENGRLAERKWWDLDFNEQTDESESQIIEHLEHLISDAVRLRLISDAPLGAFLSGGVDSSVICAFAAEQLNAEQLKTFSVTFSQDKKYDESKYANLVANHINSLHKEINLPVDFLSVLPEVVELFDEPFAVSSALAAYMMARETSQHVRAVLTGDGGDEVFGGYTFRHTIPDERFDRVAKLPFSGLRRFRPQQPTPPVAWLQPSWLRRPHQLFLALTTDDTTIRTWRYLQTLFVLNEMEKFALYTPEWAEYLLQSTGFRSTDDFLMDFFPASAPNRLARWLYFDLHTTLANEMLAKVDKATMAWGLEARNPFLDYRLVEYALALPPHLMARGTDGKRLLKRLGERHVPARVLYRPKQGFVVPLESWFRDRLPCPLDAALSRDRLKDTGVFQPDVVSRIITRHQGDRKTDLSHAIFVLAWFQMWQAGAQL